MHSQKQTLNIMMVQLFLTALLLVVLVAGSGTFGESSAEKFNSMRFSKKSAFEKREGESELDLFDFQFQVYNATHYEINNCSALPCVGSVNTTLCPAFCETNTTKFGLIMDSLIDCYVDGFCNKSFTEIKLDHAVNISVGAGGYNGICYLYGDQVTLKLTNEFHFVPSLVQAIAYQVYEIIFYEFTGLTLYCRPCLVIPTCKKGKGRCLGHQWPGHPGQGPPGSAAPAAPFQTNLTITQIEDFILFYIFGGGYYNNQLQNVIAQTSVNYATPLPTSYAEDITNGIKTLFQDYLTFYTLQVNFADIISSILYEFFATCPSCDTI